MNNERINIIIQKFATRFNNMCTSERKDMLLRERIVQYENGSGLKKYNVTYEVTKQFGSWSIDAVSRSFWIFKKKFPLLKITRQGKMIRFSGLYTSGIPEFEAHLLESKLEEYMEICKKIPQDVFVKS